MLALRSRIVELRAELAVARDRIVALEQQVHTATRPLFLPLAVAAAVVLAGILAVTQFGSPAPAQAASPSGSATCSVATLSGAYVSNQNGVQVTGSDKGPFAAAVIGHSHGFASRSLNRNISRRVSFTATYTLNPDCTGTYTITEAGAVAHHDQYSLPSGSRVTFLWTDPGVVSSGVGEARKVG